jgi:hypothetical protein
MSYLSNFKMSYFGLNLARLKGLCKIEENSNEKRTINNEPTGNRAY